MEEMGAYPQLLRALAEQHPLELVELCFQAFDLLLIAGNLPRIGTELGLLLFHLRLLLLQHRLMLRQDAFQQVDIVG